METYLESLNIATLLNKEYIFMDRFVAGIRLDPLIDVTDLCYKILTELELILVSSYDLTNFTNNK